MTPIQFKAIRKELGYTQGNLAELIGYSRAHVSNMENGHYEVEKKVELLMLLLRNTTKPKLNKILKEWYGTTAPVPLRQVKAYGKSTLQHQTL